MNNTETLVQNQRQTPRRPPGFSIWQLVMLLLSVYVLVAVLIDTVLILPAEMSALLLRIDTLICLVFIGDFVAHVVRDPRPGVYLKWGWVDLLGSIPHVQWLRWARIVRVVRVLRILRTVRSAKTILGMVFANRAKGTFASVAVATVAVMIAASIAILNVETMPHSTIRTASDALWWSFVTIATVGYGELHPVTTAGRGIAAILMTAGIGLFGTFTAYLASFFIQPRALTPEPVDELLREIELIRARLEKVERQSDETEGDQA